MTQNTSRENQIVTLKSRTVTNVTVTRIGIRERDGVTYGTCKINNIAFAVTLTENNRWTVVG